MRTEGITLCCWKAGCGESRLSGLVGGSRKRTRNGTSPACLPNGDIAACFDSLDHTVLVSILRDKIYDERFLRLIETLLQAGYLETWRFHASLSGCPQGSIVSPILANIYLDKLDKFVETDLLPAYSRGHRRRTNPAYASLQARARRFRRAGQWKQAQAQRRLMQQLPSLDPADPGYRRLH